MRKRKHILIVAIASICFSVMLLPACSKNNSNTENAAPKALLVADTARGDITTVFHFDASQSNDKEDPATSLQVGWNFGDGSLGYSPYSTIKTTTHSFANTGTYTVKLVVKDTRGLSDTAAQLIVIVSNMANLPPSKPIYTAPDNYATYLPNSVKLTWLCDDPENDILTYDIFLGYDPNVLYQINSNITVKEYTVTGMDKGTNYYWRIAARDPNGNFVLGDVWRFNTAP